MKNKLVNMALVFLMIAVITSCQKDDEMVASPSPQATPKTAGMEYGPMHCTLPNGDCGSQCAGNQGGCWTATECKGNSANYLSTLTSLYSQAEINAMARDNAAITDTQLLTILKNENTLPLK